MQKLHTHDRGSGHSMDGRETEHRGSGMFAPLGGIGLRSASEHALALLLDAIRTGMFEVGSALPPLRTLASELGVSHVVARQAIEVLVECNVVDVKPGRGGGIFLTGFSGIPQALARIYQVPDKDEARALIQARRIIELETIRMACSRIRPDELAKLGALVDRLEASQDTAEFIELTVQINMMISLAAGNPVLTRFLREILNRMAIVGQTGDSQEIRFTSIAPAAVLYRRLYEALCRHDQDAVRRHVDAHIALVSSIYGLDGA